jgi:hypothetical protein
MMFNSLQHVSRYVTIAVMFQYINTASLAYLPPATIPEHLQQLIMGGICLFFCKLCLTTICSVTACNSKDMNGGSNLLMGKTVCDTDA